MTSHKQEESINHQISTERKPYKMKELAEHNPTVHRRQSVGEDLYQQDKLWKEQTGSKKGRGTTKQVSFHNAEYL